MNNIFMIHAELRKKFHFFVFVVGNFSIYWGGGEEGSKAKILS